MVGALIADQLAAEGKAVLVLDAGLRIERAQAVENWRNMPFQNRAGSDFQGLPAVQMGAGPALLAREQFRRAFRPRRQGLQAGLSEDCGRYDLALGRLQLAASASRPEDALHLRRRARLAHLL
ncbi:hypothetical protein [Agrobacterium tumefaciens]|uniref:hypothetical protein n=1 Tax=Agrobacterium tumefaciens TaxID=358 RepID=UPI003AF60FE8